MMGFMDIKKVMLMEKETYGVLLIIGFVLVVAVGFMYYGASAGKASMFAKDVTDTVKCVFKNSEKVEKCIAERYGNSCDGVGSCEMKVRAKYGSHTNVGACGGSCGIRIEGKYKTCEFNCGPAPVEFKGYAVGDKFRITPNKAQDVFFREIRKPVKLLFTPENAFYFNDYSPGFLSLSQVVHIPVEDRLVVIRLVRGGKEYVEFQVEYIGGVEKRYQWPSLPDPAETIVVSDYRPRPDTVKLPTGSVIALKCDRLCYLSGLFDVNVGYEIKALNPGEIGKFLVRIGQSKFMVFEWGKFVDGEIIAVYGAVTPPPQSPTQWSQESMAPGG